MPITLQPDIVSRKAVSRGFLRGAEKGVGSGVFSLVPSRSIDLIPFPFRSWGWGRFCDAENATAGRLGRRPTVRPTDGSGERSVGRHGGACLRRAMFRTRTASQRIDRPRHHAACQRGAMFNAEGRGSPSDATGLAVLNTAPPGRAGRWRGGETRTQPSGVERGSTLASSVAAPAGLTTTTAITLSWSPNTRMSSSRLNRNRATTFWARRSAKPRKQPARTIPIG